MPETDTPSQVPPPPPGDVPGAHGDDRYDPLNIADELKDSYLTYAMSVIVSRALPDVRDGLKPSQRRILVAMLDLGLGPSSSTSKCAGIVGETMKRYHPHGEQTIYPTLVRMAQEWVMRHRLIHPQGNFGSLAGLPPAAMRYCVTGDTLVRTLTGTRPIRDLAAVEPNADADVFLELFNRDGRPVTASKLFHSGDHPTFRLKTVEGFELVGTSNHPVLCLVNIDGVPRLRWRLLGKIEPGTRVAMARWAAADTDDSDVSLPFLAGAFVSEGFISAKRAGFNNLDRQFFDAVLAAYDNYIGGARYVSSRVIKSGHVLHEIDVHNLTHLDRSELGELKGARSEDKFIPSFVLAGTTGAKRAFMQSLFEGDGSSSLLTRKTISISYSTRSDRLAREVQTLLLEFGVVARIARYCHGEIKVFISNRRDAKRFAERVGFWGAKQTKLVGELDQLPGMSRSLSKDMVPYLGEYVRRNSGSPWADRDWLNRHNIDRLDRWEHDSDSIMARIAAPDVRALAADLTDGRYYFATVESVTPAGVQPVYSLRVDSDCHSFITNGFVSHNTEARLTNVAAELLADLDRDTVDYIDNYDGKYREPLVLPSKFPNLLVNGSDGIAVGMATEIPPHNLGEICDGLVALIDNPELSFLELLQLVPGPDFPTGGQIMGRQGILDGYRTGRGKVVLRARAEIVEERGRTQIIFREVPFQSTRNRLFEQIGELVKDERIKGISGMRDESSARTGEPVRLVFDLKRDADPNLVLNQLYQFSPLQRTTSIILLALVDGRPRTLSLKEMMQEFLKHRVQVIRRRTEYLLREAKRRGHVLEGQLIAISSLDEVIQVCRTSPSRAEAKLRLQEITVAAAVLQRAIGDEPFAALARELGNLDAYHMTEVQADAVVNLRLGQLAALERDEIFKEYSELQGQIQAHQELLADDRNILAVVRSDLVELKAKYADDRRTEVTDDGAKIDMEELIPEETQVVTISHKGYIKRLPLNTYRSQHRGGKGVSGGQTREDDFVEHFFVASTHAYLLCFTSIGRLYWLKVYDIPLMSRTSPGRAIANVLAFKADEKISSVIPVRRFEGAEGCLLMATRRGLVKKTDLSEYSRPKQGGIIGIALEDGDGLIGVELVRPNDEVVLSTRRGMAIRFAESDARAMGRNTKGVRGINLTEGDEVVGLAVADPDGELLTVCENGYGKRTPFGPNTSGDLAEVEADDGDDEPIAEVVEVVESEGEAEAEAATRGGMRYRRQRRGGKGVRDIRTSDRNGLVVGVMPVRPDDDVMLITAQGMVNRMHADEIRVVGRNTQGVRVMKLDEGDRIATLAKVAREEVASEPEAENSKNQEPNSKE